MKIMYKRITWMRAGALSKDPGRKVKTKCHLLMLFKPGKPKASSAGGWEELDSSFALSLGEFRI